MARLRMIVHQGAVDAGWGPDHIAPAYVAPACAVEKVLKPLWSNGWATFPLWAR